MYIDRIYNRKQMKHIFFKLFMGKINLTLMNEYEERMVQVTCTNKNEYNLDVPESESPNWS